MNTEKTQQVIWSVVGLAILGVIGWAVLHPLWEPKAANSNENTNQEVSQMDATLAQLQAKYNATADWFTKQYSIEFQNDLAVRTGPIVFKAAVNDVYKKGADSHIKLSIDNYESGLPGDEAVYLDLTCNKQEVLTAVLAQKPEQLSFVTHWAVVAKLTTFRKASMKLEAVYDDDSGDASIDLAAPDAFVGTGECVAMQHVDS